MVSRGSAGAHLGDETIAAMLEGGLADDAAHRARSHIGSCDACRRLVSAAIETDPRHDATAAGMPRTIVHVHGVEVGELIAGRYRVEHLLGEGGMGRVYAARQIDLERLVALKILRPELSRDAMALKRFRREARLLGSLTGDQVVRVFDFGELASGEPYLVMEMLEGEELAAILLRGPVSVEQAVAWIGGACDALGEAHALGIVHRDIKPSNLFVTRDNRIKVVDFGLAKLAAGPSTSSGSMTGAGMILGSPQYMAPEQIVGSRDVDARADIWSLGATLYHLVSGAPPFSAPTVDQLFASILGGDMPALDRLPPWIAAVVRRAMDRDSAGRFATVGQLAAALRAPDLGRAHPRSRSRRFAILATAGFAGIAGGLALWQPWSTERRADPPSVAAAPVPAAAVAPAPVASDAPTPIGAQPSAEDAAAAPVRVATSGPRSPEGSPFSITPPAGWSFATEAIKQSLGVGPETLLLLPDHRSPGKVRASLVIEDMELAATDPEMAQLHAASADYCTDLGQQSEVTMSGKVTSAKPARFGAFTGCDIEVANEPKRQALRSISLSNGKIALAIVCLRDLTGDPPVDTACVAVANTLLIK